ncbi:hypothetical protein [Nocardia altamirensis]|uniref:hypothetical protein n=1 Tax=Nocardia altamirensis TaxID=472158 RepID=UPI0008409357|nr:hypothetical protein [Nocardia altamirensis]
MADTSGTRMTGADIRQFFELLQRWCDTELDQFANLIIPTQWGEVYANFGRELPAEHQVGLYERLPTDWSGETG